MTAAERQLLIKTAEHLAGMLSLLSSAPIGGLNAETVNGMALELLRCSNAVQAEETDRLTHKYGT